MENWEKAGTVPGLWTPPPLPADAVKPAVPAQLIVQTKSSTGSAGRGLGFRDPTQLTQWLKYAFYLYTAATVVALGSSMQQLQMLSDLSAGRASAAAATANDERQRIVAIAQIATVVACVIVFASWVYRANYNVRQLGAAGLQFSPGWAVGWYFVPLAFMWKPYQAMKEIGARARTRKVAPVDSVVKRWWFFWLAYCFLGNAAFRASLAAHTADALHMATVVSVVADAAGLLSAMVVLTMIREIYTMQMNKVREALPI
jgi:hypothetical protein